jgi:hypothetical protein
MKNRPAAFFCFTAGPPWTYSPPGVGMGRETVVAKLTLVEPGNDLTKQATKQAHQEDAPKRKHQLGVHPEFGEMVARYCKQEGIPVWQFVEEALEAYGIREKYAKVLEDEARRVRTSKRHSR